MRAKLLGGSVATFLRQLISLLLGILLLSILSKNMSPLDYGQAIIIQLTVQWTAIFLTWSVPAYLIHCIASENTNNLQYSQSFSAYIHFILIITIVVSCIGYLYSLLSLIYCYSLLLLGVTIAGDFYHAILSGKQQYIKSDFISIVNPLVILLIVNLTSVKISSEWYLGFLSIAVFSTSLLKYIYIVKYGMKEWLRPKISIHDIPLLMKKSTPVAIANLSGFGVYRVHFFIIEKFMGEAYLGVFSMAQQVAEKSWMLSQSVASVIYPLLSKDGIDSVRKNIRLLQMIIFSVTLLTFIALVIIASMPKAFFVLLVGSEFVNIGTIILQLSVGVAMWSGVKIMSAILAANGQFYMNVKVALSTIAGSSIVMIFLGYFYPSYIVIGVVVGYFGGFSLSYYYIYQVLHEKNSNIY